MLARFLFNFLLFFFLIVQQIIGISIFDNSSWSDFEILKTYEQRCVVAFVATTD